MKKIYLHIIICSLLITTLNFSCKKESLNTSANSKVVTNANINPTISAAKNWYQKIYNHRLETANTNRIKTNSVQGSDLSKIITPDWQLALTYTKNGKEIIEIPLSDSTKIAFLTSPLKFRSIQF